MWCIVSLLVCVVHCESVVAVLCVVSLLLVCVVRCESVVAVL